MELHDQHVRARRIEFEVQRTLGWIARQKGELLDSEWSEGKITGWIDAEEDWQQGWKDASHSRHVEG